MIVRDEHNIIVQQPSMDGGDSAARMGISALENSESLINFRQFNSLVRHPFQEEWAAPKKTSRDQLVQFCVSKQAVPQLVALTYKDKWFINKDFLDFSVKLYLHAVCGAKPPLWLKVLGTVNMWAALLWNTKIKPSDELNQFACQCIVMGPHWCKRLVTWHPNIDSNIMDYWSGWRDQPELGHILLRKLNGL